MENKQMNENKSSIEVIKGPPPHGVPAMGPWTTLAISMQRARALEKSIVQIFDSFKQEKAN